MNVGTLEIELMANMARLQKDMDAARSSVGAAMSSIEKSVAGAKNALRELAAGFTAAAFIGMIKGAIEAMDKLNDLSKTTGIAIEQLAGLKLAAKQSGGDLDGIAVSINKLNVAMGKDPEKFAKLGVTAKEPLEAFKQLSNVFKDIKDPQLRAALGAEALGKSWASAAPLLMEGGEKIGEMVAKGAALSGVTAQAALDADAFNDKLAEMATKSESTAVKIATELLPTLIFLADEFTKVGADGDSMASVVGRAIRLVIESLVMGVAEIIFALKLIWREAKGAFDQLVALKNLDFKGFKAISAAVTEDTRKARVALDMFEADLTRASFKNRAGMVDDPRLLSATVDSIEDQKRAAAAAAKAKAFVGGTGAASTADAEAKAAQKALLALGLMQAAQVKQNNDLMAIENELGYRRGLINEAAYFAAKLQLQLDSNAAEQLANKTALDADKARAKNKTLTPTQRNTLGAEISALETKGIELKTKAMGLNGAEAIRLADIEQKAREAYNADMAKLFDAGAARVKSLDDEARSIAFAAAQIGEQKIQVETLATVLATEEAQVLSLALAESVLNRAKAEGRGETAAQLAGYDAAISMLGKMQAAAAAAAAGSAGNDLARAGLEQAKRLGLDVPADPFKDWGSTLKAAFGGAADGMVQVLSSMSALSVSNATYAKEIELINAAKKAGAAPDATDAQKSGAATAAKAELALIKQTKAAQLDNYAAMAGAAKGYFDKHTTAYKLLDGVEKAMHLGKMAMMAVEQGGALAAFATEVAAAWAAAGVKTAAAGTAITADVSMTAAGETAKAASKAPSVIMEFMTWLGPWGAAAAAVAIAAVLGGGSSSPVVTTDAFSAQKANTGTGTVLGDSSAQSKSIENSLSALEGMAKPELSFISQMVTLLQGIKDGLAGTTNAILSSGIDLSGADFTGSSSSSGGGIIGAIFGTSSSSTSLTDLGLAFAKQTVAQAMSTVSLQKYLTTKTDWSSSGFLGFGSSSGSDTRTGFSDIGDGGKLATSLTSIVQKVAESITKAGVQLGATPAQLAAMGAVDSGLGKLSLKGLKSDEVTALLGSVFSAMSDNMALAVMPGLTAFNKTGTGYAETLIKVSAATETAKQITDQLGTKEVSLAALRNKLAADTSAELVRQSVMDAETTRTKIADAYTQSIDFGSGGGGGLFDGLGVVVFRKFEAVFSESLSGIGEIIKTYTGTGSDLAALYTSLTQARTALVTMGFSADIVGTQLLKGAGGMDALTSGLADYASGFLGKQEQLALKQAAMDDKFKAIGRTTPATAADFVALVDGLKAGGAASAYALGQVIVLSSGMKDLTDAATAAKDALSATAQALADASQVATDAMAAVQKAVDAQKKIITDSYNATTKPLQASLDVIVSSVGKLQGLAGNLKTAMDAMKVSGQDTAQRAQAQAAIHDALVQARAGGGLPVSGEITQALQTVAKPSEALYSTYAAYAKDFYRTANEISALSEMTNTQLSGELLSQSLLKDQLAALKTGFDASIAALDLIASGAQAQLDAALGLGVTMGDINKQLGSLHAAITLLAPAKAADAAERGGRINAYVGTLDWAEAGKDVSVAKLYAEATKNGWTQAQLASATGYALPDVAALFSTRGLPSFDVGTNFVPHDMVANIHEGEAIVPRAFNPAAHGRGGTGSDAELIAELRTANALLTETVRELQGLRGATNEVGKQTGITAKTLVRVTRDGEGMVNEPQQDIQKVRVVA